LRIQGLNPKHKEFGMCEPETNYFESSFEDESIRRTLDGAKFQYFRVKSKQPKFSKDGDLIYNGTKGIKKGVFVAAPHPIVEDRVIVGCTLCNFAMGDGFDREFGFLVALERGLAWAEKGDVRKKSENGVEGKTRVPESMKEDFKVFVQRMKKHFKGAHFPEWVDNFCNNKPKPRLVKGDKAKIITEDGVF
jgi:hypothetical protein